MLAAAAFAFYLISAAAAADLRHLLIFSPMLFSYAFIAAAAAFRAQLLPPILPPCVIHMMLLDIMMLPPAPFFRCHAFAAMPLRFDDLRRRVSRRFPRTARHCHAFYSALLRCCC